MSNTIASLAAVLGLVPTFVGSTVHYRLPNTPVLLRFIADSNKHVNVSATLSTMLTSVVDTLTEDSGLATRINLDRLTNALTAQITSKVLDPAREKIPFHEAAVNDVLTRRTRTIAVLDTLGTVGIRPQALGDTPEWQRAKAVLNSGCTLNFGKSGPAGYIRTGSMDSYYDRGQPVTSTSTPPPSQKSRPFSVTSPLETGNNSHNQPLGLCGTSGPPMPRSRCVH